MMRGKQAAPTERRKNGACAMRQIHPLTLVATSLVLAATASAAAGEMKMALDSATDPKLLSARFGRYGYSPMKTVATDAKGGVRFQLPAGTKGIHQTGLTSF